MEMGFAIGHVGYALLFFLLKQRNALAQDCRIAITASAVHDPKHKDISPESE